MGVFSGISGFLSGILGIYTLAVWIRLILSWVRNPDIQQSRFYVFLSRITDPFLNLFRSRRFRQARVDWSPLFALMTLNMLRSILQLISALGKVTVWMILAVVIQNMWGYIFRYVLIILLIMLIVRWFMGRRFNQGTAAAIETLDRNLNAPVGVVFRLFFSHKNPSDQTLVGASVLFYGAIYLAFRYGIQALTAWLIAL